MTTQQVKWNLEADYFQACNCDYGCPCEFEAPPTQGYWEGVGAWRINRGSYGNVSLDGLGFAFAARWPGPIHQGNGTVALFFDERANQQQRDALMNIATGQAGGIPFEIIVTTFTNVLDPQYVPFQFNVKGRESSVRGEHYPFLTRLSSRYGNHWGGGCLSRRLPDWIGHFPLW